MTAASKPFSSGQKWAIAVGVCLYLAAATLGTLYGSAATYMLLHKKRPAGIEATTMVDFWDAYSGDPQERKKLKLAIVLPAIGLYLLLPLLIVAAGRKQRELHGSARFANRKEVQDAGLMGEGGIVIGKFQGKYLNFTGKQSVVLSAPTRSGKGVGIVVPNLLAWQDSAVVMDIKYENFNLTAGFRAKHGQEVYAWAPFAQDSCTHRWNPLSYIRSDFRHVVGDTLAVAQELYPTSIKGDGATQFFNDSARNLFMGLVLYLVETPELPRTIGEVLRQASGKGKSIKQHLQTVLSERSNSDRPLTDACVDALMRFVSTEDKTLSNILSTLNAPLTIFADPLVDVATSANDFSLLDLRRKRMTVYVCVPPNRLADARVLVNLFFGQLLSLNTNELPEHNPELKHQCLLVLDECTAFGRINILATAIGYLAGYNLRLITVIQAISQLESVYGKDDARTFVTNHALQILYAPREQKDANEYSEMLGTFTQREESKSRTRNHGARGGLSQGTNESSQRRALLLPQEFKELGGDHEVVMLENCKPILADKIRYYTDPVFMPRLLPPPTLPQQDLALHRARLERRTRPITERDDFTLDQIAVDFQGLPKLTDDATDDHLKAFSAGFFNLIGALDFSEGQPSATPSELALAA